MKLFQLLIKPAGPDCNLRCGYCFYLRAGTVFPHHPVHRMGRDVLEEMIRQFFHHALPRLRRRAAEIRRMEAPGGAGSQIQPGDLAAAR